MPARKKNAVAARPAKQKTPPPPAVFDLDALLMIGEERVILEPEENHNVNFMAEIIDPL